MNDMVEMDLVREDAVRACARTEALYSIAQLEGEIARVLRSQKTMREANRALRAGSSQMLRDMSFSDDHIAELVERVRAGSDAFPDYAFRNNTKLIRALHQQLQAERVQLSKLDDMAQAPKGKAAGPGPGRYWCNTDNPATVPFLAAFLPFNR